MLDAAHDLSVGGLAQALVEMAVRNGTGAAVRLPAALDPFVALFSESRPGPSSPSARAAVAPSICTCGRHQVPVTRSA